MPMANDELCGTNADGSKNGDYCTYCYENGAFTADCTMEEMIDFCVKPMVEANPAMSAEEAKGMMQKVFPNLKRWQQA